MKIIAEIGLNHLGNGKNAFEMVKKCINLGVDGVSIQIQPDEYYDNSKVFRRKLNFNVYKKISKFVKKKRKEFGLAIVKEYTIKRFTNVHVDFWKILSMDFKNLKLIKSAYTTKKNLYISTGVANMKEIRSLGKKFSKANFIHTTLSDKTNMANILAIRKMKNILKNKISFGLHSENHIILLGVVALKPDTIFFYVKKNDKKYYPDDKHAINFKQLSEMIKYFKIIKSSLGDGEKKSKKIPDWVYE